MVGKKQVVRDKAVDGIYMADANIVRKLETVKREEMHVMQKSEGGKIREVVKTGNGVNRKMAYCSEFLEAGLCGSSTSTLFAGEEGNELIDIDLINAARNEAIYKVPLD